jgi:hypothetical protein
MKKNRKDKFLEFLVKVPIVSSACEAAGLSRMTVYRWHNEDLAFAKAMDAALTFGVKSINDLAESKVVKMIQGGDFKATKYWLDNHKKNYARPRPKDFWTMFKSDRKIGGFEIHVIKSKEDLKRYDELKELEKKYGKRSRGENGDVIDDDLGSDA